MSVSGFHEPYIERRIKLHTQNIKTFSLDEGEKVKHFLSESVLQHDPTATNILCMKG